MIYLTENRVNLVGTLRRDTEEGQRQRVIMVRCCSFHTGAASVVVNISYSNLQGRRFAEQSTEMLNPTELPRAAGPFQPYIPSCFLWVPVMNLQEFTVGQNTRIWSSVAKRDVPIEIKVFSESCKKHQRGGTLTSQILKNSGRDFSSATCETFGNYN